jgi:hypothetical protein
MAAMRRRNLLTRGAIALLAAGYFALLVANTGYFAAGPDTSGYLSEARLIAAGKTSVVIEPMVRAGLPASMAYLFTPYGFMPAEARNMVPTYPVGTPVHLALAAAIGGWARAPFLVAPVAAVASLFLVAAIGRRIGLTSGWAIAGAAILGAFPVYVSMSLQPMSDVLATAWTLAAVLCALKSRDGAWQWAMAASAAFCIGVAVRPSNVLLALPLIVAIGWRPARLAIAGVTAVPFAGALMFWHQALYGSPFKTGYGSAGSVLSSGASCGGTHIAALASMLTPLVLVGAIAVVFDGRVAKWQRALLVAWPAVFLLFYAFYDYCPDAMATRFLLPALPAMILGALLVASRWRAVAVALVLVVLTREVVQIGRMHVLHRNEWESIFPRTVTWVEGVVPPDGVVCAAITSGAFYYQAGRITVRWDQLEPHTAAVLRGAPGLEGPWYAVVSDVEGGEAALRARIPGEWRLVGRERDVTLWRLERSPLSGA